MSQIHKMLHPSPLTNETRCYMQQNSGNNQSCIQRQVKTAFTLADVRRTI